MERRLQHRGHVAGMCDAVVYGYLQETFLDALAKFLEFLKVPIRYIIGAFVVSAVFVFTPDSFLTSLGVLKYRQEGKLYFGLLFLALFALIVAAIAGFAIEKTHNYFFLRTRKKRLALLTVEEKQILGSYIEGETRTLYLSAQSGVVKGLVHEHIIYMSSSVNRPEFGALTFAHNIQPWAWEYLNNHRDLLLTHGSDPKIQIK